MRSMRVRPQVGQAMSSGPSFLRPMAFKICLATTISSAWICRQGDTFRVTLTADPAEEVVVARRILKAMRARERTARSSSPAPPAAAPASISFRWPRRSKNVWRAAPSPSPWRSWAAPSTAPAKGRRRQTAASPAATARDCSFRQGKVLKKVPQEPAGGRADEAD